MCSVLLGIVTFSSVGSTPTAAQIAQFQRLPKAQQEVLAKQMGIDIRALQSSSSSSSKKVGVSSPVRTTQAVSVVGSSSQIKSTKYKSELLPFGYDVLNGKSLDYTAIDDLPVPNDYIMAAGDQINIQLYGKISQEYQFTINREGNINFPEFGPVAVSGQTFSEMRKQIQAMVEQRAIGIEAIVTMGEMRSMQVYVVGEAIQPGAYNVNGLTTITQALVASGGVKETGSLRNIQLKRKGKVVTTLDLYDLLIKGDSSADIRLLSGDTLFIPTIHSQISISGEVFRPAIYELKNKATINDIIELAGGEKPSAYLSQVNVERITENGIELFNLDLTKRREKQFVLQRGDTVRLVSSPANMKGVIALRGELVRQGALHFQEGMKVSDVIKSIESDLKPTADLNYALVVRETEFGNDISVHQFNLGNAIRFPKSKDNLALQEKDQLFVFDNGIDLSYWYRQQVVKKARAHNTNDDKVIEKIDIETGAVVESGTINKINVKEIEEVSQGENIQQSSREKLLTPIIERLKSQANYDKPAKLISIDGAVKFPGTYPYPENQSIEQVIIAAGGLTEKAYLASAEVSRIYVDGENSISSYYPFNLRAAMKGQDVGIELQPQDKLFIKQQPNWQKGLEVELQGEVMFPGKYSFQRGDRLSDVIERAGGLTEFAYIEGAVFSRDRIQRQEQERLRLLNIQLKQEIASLALRRQNSSTTYTSSPLEAMQVAEELSQTEAMGRLVIDLKLALAENLTADLLLEKGDKLFIPTRNPTISVMGEVQYVSNHTYQPGQTVEDYILSAGGVKKQADSDRIYVVRADGSVMLPNNSFWFSREDNPLQPGDTIIVPIDTDYLDGLSTLTSATQILYQIGVAWSAVKN